MEEVLSWLSDKESIASSNDYGKDFEHLQVVQKKFEDFKRDVSASTERYTAANNLARRLVAEGHSDTVLIKEKQDAMRYTTQVTRVCKKTLSHFFLSLFLFHS